ncbi:60S ribosomal protein L35, L29 [Diatrype stigma]|uniref:60S ribosomal protein L35, L29 n=1 Tax=Diatrype stigma TaxID=117547 RepID=A0AAN9YNY7_9PEZI
MSAEEEDRAPKRIKLALDGSYATSTPKDFKETPPTTPAPEPIQFQLPSPPRSSGVACGPVTPPHQMISSRPSTPPSPNWPSINPKVALRYLDLPGTPVKMSSPKVKTATLWSKNKDDLLKTLTELKAELGQLRIQKVTSSGTKLNKIHDLRKSIARVLTIVNIKQRSQLRLFYKNKKYLPLDLRPKQTRAIRRRLSPEEKSQVLEKTKKRQTHFPQRKFAVKV